MLGVEGVLHTNGNILHANGIDGGGIYNFRSEVAELHGLHIRQFVDGIGRLDDSRVGSHETIHVGPNFEYIGIESCRDDGSRVVATSASKVGGFAAIAVAADESRHDGNARHVGKRLSHEAIGQLRVELVLTVLALCADEVAGIHAHRPADERGDDVRTDALAIADDSILRLLAQVVNEIYAEEDGT